MEQLSKNLKEQKETIDDHIYSEKSKLHKEYKMQEMKLKKHKSKTKY